VDRKDCHVGTGVGHLFAARRNIKTQTYLYDKNTALVTDMTRTAWRTATDPRPAVSGLTRVVFSGRVTMHGVSGRSKAF
jgi:hypothetical protein